MPATINLKSSYLNSVRQRGVAERERESYLEVLRELAEFLHPSPPSAWAVLDLERFLKLRMANLDQSQRRRYALGLGVLTEIIEKSRSTGVELLYVPPATPDVTLETQENPPVDFDSTHIASGPFKREPTPPPTTVSERAIRPRSGLFGASREADALLSGFGSHSTSTARRSRIQVDWNEKGRYLDLLWVGSVPGDQMRARLRLALSLQRTYKATCWLADMGSAKVMGQEDADWFSSWLQRVERSGGRYFAVVTPEHVITKLQLGRVCGITGSFFLGTVVVGELTLQFFDSPSEARIWLMSQDH